MKNKGLAVVIKNELEFNLIKEFLGKENLYIHFVPQMAEIKTSIVIFADRCTFLSTGTVGKAEMQENLGLRLVEFNNFFKLTT
ncbi:hypothetical protein Phi4:1_gp183 [Cellulophaga phage phi4:1]|uniref:Uncharacterized protein n=3 Tax=Lightbulbvirus Cba41 TaxID=1918524 RepID=A0A0S2MWU2_9CAUD|nr:hypothetical protein Phi4:1_gp183 [Cellulophaga phage phi4:1]AGO49596.1 hypothetical protein Phi4:1_gp183 [Cellulophaga phage phi4:1]ALO80192.1 hypothetical protein Phi4113_183 [Cellulophaga phage phi4:1_13]ALO80389.1 hypothetical protein Phi4118_183 [Cellulophaga phage phi4:1_18]